MTEAKMWNGIYKSGGSGMTPTNLESSFNRLIEMSLELIEHVEDPLVVDDGCGKGELAIEIAAEREDARVKGIDASDVGIDIARRNASERGIENAVFINGKIEDCLESRIHDERDLSIAINTYQYFINGPGSPNDKALRMIESLSDNIKCGGYFLMTAPSLEFFGRELFPKFIDYTEPLPCYRIRLPNGEIPHQETLFGKIFLEIIESDYFKDMRLLDYGKIPFDATSIFPIVSMAKRFDVYMKELEEKAGYYTNIQKADPSKGPTVDWYLFQKF
jgi:precorrin-6B methylase 2